MSSAYVRQEIIDFLQTNAPTENLMDLTADFNEISDLLAENNLTMDDDWLGIQFFPSEEVPVSLTATNNKGRYRETGLIYLHVVAVSSLGCHNGIITRAEYLRDILRGMVIADTIYIEQVNPIIFGAGATISFEGGFTAGMVSISYRRDLDL